MRLALHLAFLLPVGAHATTTYFTYNGDTAFFSMLSRNNLLLGQAGTTSVSGDIGIGNSLSVRADSTVNGMAYLPGGQTCASNCANILGGFELNSAQVNASLAAWSALATAVAALPITGSFFGPTTLTPGVYSASSLLLSNSDTLTFDAQGDPAAQFVVRTGTFRMGDSSKFNFINGAQPQNVLILSQNVLLATTGSLGGSIYSDSGITRQYGTTAERLTLVGFNIAYSGDHAGPAATVPEPSAAALLLLGGAGMVLARLRVR